MNFSEANTNGLPAVAAHLFEAAKALSHNHHYRPAALVYASASRATGITRYNQALSLYEASAELFKSIQVSRDEIQQEEDKSRSIGYLTKCLILIKDIEISTIIFNITMEIYSLIEKINSFISDDLSCAKSINSALHFISTYNSNDNNKLRWWCYFRSRAISNAISSGNSLQQAADLANESAEVCYRSGDSLSCIGFYLCQCQIILGCSVIGINNLKCNITKCISIFNELTNVPINRNMDYLLLKFSLNLLQSLDFIRHGDLKSLKDNLGYLSKSYNKYRQIIKQKQERNENETTGWSWLPDNYLSAIAYYVMTAVSKSNCDIENSLIHAMTSLSRLGIPEDKLASFTLSDISINSNIKPKATLSLIIALLENAARIRLTQVHLNEAAILIGAAVDLTFRDEISRTYIRLAECEKLPNDINLSHVIVNGYEDIGIIPRCTSFTLLAEYHNLRGRVSGARIATSFLDAVRAVVIDDIPNLNYTIPISDTWQMVISYLSLLTGDDRSTLASQSSTGNNLVGSSSSGMINENDFVSTQVYALAWFTVGVYHMRKTDILESRKAISMCLDIVNQSPLGNDQIIGNASAVLSSLVITREVNTQGLDMAITAVDLARNIGDIVGFVRATRQQKKVVYRLSESQEQRDNIEHIANNAFAQYTERTKGVGQIFSA